MEETAGVDSFSGPADTTRDTAKDAVGLSN